jgi:WD40 repeat protein
MLVLPISLLACAASPHVAEPVPPVAEPAPPVAELDAPAATPPATPATPAPVQPTTWAQRFEHGEPIDQLTLSPDGSLLASRGATQIKVWDAHTGELRATLAKESIAANDRRRIALSSETLVVTGVKGYRAFTTVNLADQTTSGTSLGPKPCGPLAAASSGMFVVTCEDDKLYVLTPVPPTMEPTWTEDVPDRTEAVALSPDGVHVAILSIDRLAIMRTVDGTYYEHGVGASQKLGLGVAFTRDGKLIVVSWHTGLNVYDVAAKKWIAEIRLRKFPEMRARHLDVSPDGAYVIVAGALLRMSDILAARRRAEVTQMNTTTYPTDVIFAGDGTSLYVPTADGAILRTPMLTP